MRGRTNNLRSELQQLATERRSATARKLSELSIKKILLRINQEDQKVATSVRKEIPRIEEAVNAIVPSLRMGGRLFYVGAGTSGRLGVVDAAELFPTFGVGSESVRAIIAGGRKAVFRSVEGAEDNVTSAAMILKSARLTSKDVVLGISASGRTPFVVGALLFAEKIKAKTIALTVNPGSQISKIADTTICPRTGTEVLAGSTRMKAGTAQKMVLNMISTTVMIKLGRAYLNLLVDLKPFSKKLVERSKRILVTEGGVDYGRAERLLSQTHMNIKLALLMAKTGLAIDEASGLLESASDSLEDALKIFSSRRIGRKNIHEILGKS